MSALNNGWKASVRPDLITFGSRVLIWRNISDTEVQLFGPDNTVRTVSADVDPSPDDVLMLPTEALGALRDAIDQQLGRRYDETMVKELRASLEVERARVDRVLGGILNDGAAS